MRNHFLIVTLAFNINYSWSQYVEWPDSSASWVNIHYSYVQNFDIWGNSWYTLEQDDIVGFCVNGEDTLIGTETYTKVDTCLTGGYKGALRSENRIVYYVPKDSSQEYLIYNFNVLPGDTVNFYYEDFYANYSLQSGQHILQPGSVDSSLFQGKWRKTIDMGGSRWIEGIGNSYGLFLEHWDNVSMYLVELNCMSLNDTVHFINHDTTYIAGNCQYDLGFGKSTFNETEILVFPNPAHDLVNLTFESPNILSNQVILRIFDIQGNQVTIEASQTNEGYTIPLDDLEQGLYFLDIQIEDSHISKKITKL